MTPEERSSVKIAYFDLLDLIIKYRKDEPLGKLGLTHIPKLELDAIRDLKFETSIQVLHTDKILGSIQKKEKLLLYDIQKTGIVETIIFDCLKTAEDMIIYKNSLIVEEGWPSIQVTPFNDPTGISSYIMRRRNLDNHTVDLSLNEGKIIVYLLKDNNMKNSRKEIAIDNNITVEQVSNFKNVIRKKLQDLGFSKEQAEEMLPTYNR